ncbi:MAG: vWA domain-containing protein [Sporichthyaceae bacterium]
MSAADPRIAAARLWASARMPYLSSAVFACRIVPAPEIGTIRIDEGWTVHADPAVVATTTVENLGKLLLHLSLHVLREHADRARHHQAGEGSWWNRCTDAEINDDLAVVDAVPPAAPDLPENVDGVPHRLAEEYFAAEAEIERAMPRHWDCGSGADGNRRADDESGLSALQAQQLQAQTAASVRDAHSQKPGSVPGGLLRWAHGVLEPRIDWRRVLAAELRRACAWASGQVDHSYARPSRRAAVMHPVVVPRLVRPTPNVAVVVDTSASMDDGMLAQALAEIDGLTKRAGLRTGGVRVLAVDTKVYLTRRVTSAAQMDLAGGGGTDMGHGIEQAAALRPRPSVVVVLTDGWTPWPAAAPPGIRVVVGLIGRGAPDPPQWARVARIETDLGDG